MTDPIRFAAFAPAGAALGAAEALRRLLVP